jgi:GalNAc-alpha-(1->4)-GalNAc-alpha-(1->3)-diNAcBac-PP-undecaprenol alpha-1,4-N-acetyl-D-galactosaminyltransferase
MKITLVIAKLSGGGAERVAANMANYWAAKGWGVSVLTTGCGGEPPGYDLHPRVGHLPLGQERFGCPPTDPQSFAPLAGLLAVCSPPEREGLLQESRRIMRLRGALLSTEPDVVISYIDRTNINVLAATRGTGLPVIVNEQCDVGNNFIGPGWDLLRRRLYRESNFVVVLTEESLDYFSPDASLRGRIIPNPLTPSVFSEPRVMPGRKKGRTLMAMGRLAREKGFDLLLHVFSLVAKKHPDWTLEILGEGTDRPYLESCAAELGLGEQVRLPGFTRRPFQALRRADLFVLSSLCEGFPNALLEAMACGVAVVSFDCPSGPRHIIRDGVDGVLVPPRNGRAMAAALDRLMGDEQERRRLAARATEVAERFSMEKVMGMWEELIFDCAG